MAKSFHLSREIIEKIFRHHSLGTIKEFKTLEGGYGSPVVLINNTYVIKSNEGKHEGHTERITREAITYSILQKHNIPSPDLIAYSTDKQIVPFCYLIVSFLQGDTLTFSYEQQTIETRKKLAHSLGKF